MDNFKIENFANNSDINIYRELKKIDLTELYLIKDLVVKKIKDNYIDTFYNEVDYNLKTLTDGESEQEIPIEIELSKLEFILKSVESLIVDKEQNLKALSDNKDLKLSKEISLYDLLDEIKTDLIQNIEDFSDNKDIDKVRTLILLGVVDDLRKTKYKHSIGALSLALSGVLGIKEDTLRGYLNAYLSESAGKNNPMNNKNAVQQIKNKLGIT